MALDMEVGLSPGHIVLDGDPATPPKGSRAPQFSIHFYCGQMAGCIKMPSLGVEVGLSPGDFVLDGNSAPPPKRGRSPLIFAHVWSNSWMDQRCHLVLGPGDIVLDGYPAPPPKSGTAPNFRPKFIVAKGLYVSGYHLVRR